MKVEIDSDSGFCFGVVTAINKAEEELSKSGALHCLGDIVHNAREVERLEKKGLETITHDRLASLRGGKVLLRAHGEPPATYETARRNGIEIIDATCPVVLQLQRRIKQAFDQSRTLENPPLILIYGKLGHAEVNGLVGQTEGEAVVIQDLGDLDRVDLDRDILLYSQTTKSLEGFREVVAEIKRRKHRGSFEYFDTICRQVANRMQKIKEFAMSHDVVLFVSGAKSSNGKVLYSGCLDVNPHTHLVTDADGLQPEWFAGAESVGVCGATSTPSWLMSEVARRVEQITDSIHPQP
ncbi:MAG: 4-hydroxy-3-methylbut-2-enyl diphosphate reductase [Bacteroides sp.]|nr:4-hydroxy-3-methylbut-2-enyl diphosphate reductase [Bacteroides sp.]MBD5307544.1 4-hydroxy-3-methylbut-2-enyl diphosphate reductase [Bacteroides sp.]